MRGTDQKRGGLRKYHGFKFIWTTILVCYISLNAPIKSTDYVYVQVNIGRLSFRLLGSICFLTIWLVCLGVPFRFTKTRFCMAFTKRIACTSNLCHVHYWHINHYGSLRLIMNVTFPPWGAGGLDFTVSVAPMQSPLAWGLATAHRAKMVSPHRWVGWSRARWPCWVKIAGIRAKLICRLLSLFCSKCGCGTLRVEGRRKRLSL